MNLKTDIVRVSAPSATYQVHIGKQLLAQVGKRCASMQIGQKIALISDDNVLPLYGDIVTKSLQTAGFEVHPHVFAAGEQSKTLATYLGIVDFLAAQTFTRQDSILALGGGVVGDMAGFAAATYLRGVPYIQVPTTILAAIDSSVGGKTAVNLPAGKNLLGAFYQPRLVLCDIDTFATLPFGVMCDGMAEAIKYGVLQDPALFDLCSKPAAAFSDADWASLVTTCVGIKSSIVAQDERDTGTRQCLNLGHTIGHAIERCSNYRLHHGAAVAMGLYMMSQAAVQLHGADPALPSQILQALMAWSLAPLPDFSAQALYQAALHDKKRAGQQITIVVPQKIGRAVLREIPLASLYQHIQIGLEGAL